MSTGVFEDELDLTMQLDTEGVDADSIYEGIGVSAAGYYHVIVEDVAVDGGANDKLKCLKVTMRVLDGTVENQGGKKVYHRIYVEGWETKPNKEKDIAGVKKPIDKRAHEGIAAFAYAFGLIEEFGETTQVNFAALPDRQAVVQISEGEYQGKKQYRIDFNNQCWPINHDKVRDVPKDAEYLAMIGGLDGQAAGSGNVDGDLDDI